MHLPCANPQNDRNTVPSAHFLGGLLLFAEVYVLSAHGQQTGFSDGIERFFGCAVIQSFGRLLGPQTQVDLDAVALVGPDAQTIIAERKPLLVVGVHHLLECLVADVPALSR